MKKIILPKNTERENILSRVFIAIVIIFALFIVSSSIAALVLLKGDDYIKPDANTIIIPIYGVITSMPLDTSSYGVETVSADNIKELIKKATEHKNTKAIIFEINSPGGSAVASDEIGQLIKDIDPKIKTVAWIRETGASGGYWVASAADYIIANKMSITGSIGVTASYLEFADLLKRYNVTYRQLISGDKKDLGTPLRNLQPEEAEFILDKLRKIHWFFIKEVSENRNISFEDVEKFATGEIFLGYEAKERGLIDAIGGEKEVLGYVEKIIGEKPVIARLEKKLSLFEQLARALSPRNPYLVTENSLKIET